MTCSWPRVWVQLLYTRAMPSGPWAGGGWTRKGPRRAWRGWSCGGGSRDRPWRPCRRPHACCWVQPDRHPGHWTFGEWSLLCAVSSGRWDSNSWCLVITTAFSIGLMRVGFSRYFFVDCVRDTWVVVFFRGGISKWWGFELMMMAMPFVCGVNVLGVVQGKREWDDWLLVVSFSAWYLDEARRRVKKRQVVYWQSWWTIILFGIYYFLIGRWEKMISFEWGFSFLPNILWNFIEWKFSFFFNILFPFEMCRNIKSIALLRCHLG